MANILFVLTHMQTMQQIIFLNVFIIWKIRMLRMLAALLKQKLMDLWVMQLPKCFHPSLESAILNLEQMVKAGMLIQYRLVHLSVRFFLSMVVMMSD